MKRDVGEEPFGRSRARPMKLRPPLALEMVRPAALFPLPATNGKDGGAEDVALSHTVPQLPWCSPVKACYKNPVYPTRPMPQLIWYSIISIY